mmetsp:Transcript_13204/g.52683  ORF Transcript_13204/g.52683 Transcript_13204/m.52683 type:complete len:277 (-) Transcript_13204:309-1139(-)
MRVRGQVLRPAVALPLAAAVPREVVQVLAHAQPRGDTVADVGARAGVEAAEIPLCGGGALCGDCLGVGAAAGVECDGGGAGGSVLGGRRRGGLGKRRVGRAHDAGRQPTADALAPVVEAAVDAQRRQHFVRLQLVRCSRRRRLARLGRRQRLHRGVVGVPAPSRAPVPPCPLLARGGRGGGAELLVEEEAEALAAGGAAGVEGGAVEGALAAVLRERSARVRRERTRGHGCRRPSASAAPLPQGRRHSARALSLACRRRRSRRRRRRRSLGGRECA